MGTVNDIYSLIERIAQDQLKENEPIKRDDLAYILCQKLGLEALDGVTLESYVYKAYLQFDKSEVIRNMIVSNDGTTSVVAQAALRELAQEGITDEVMSIVSKDMQATEESIRLSGDSLGNVLNVALAKDVASLYSWLQGKNGIEEIGKKGSLLMENYEKMVQGYQAAESGVKRDIHDFVELRSCVNAVFMQNASLLVDVFGDSIKVVAPELFDFDTVKWLDVTKMQEKSRLEYDKLSEKCALLLGEVSERFNSLLANASGTALAVRKWKGAGSGKSLGIYGLLAVQAVRCLNHLLDANAKKTQLTEQYVRFEDSVKRDKLKVSADLKRLAIIHKTLNDLYIPKADAFARLSNRVLSDDFDQLIAEIYSGEEVRSLKAERDELLRRCKELEESINDHQENIALFDYQIEDWKGMLASQKETYDKAKKEKPSRPNALVKLLTFGYSQRKYEENITDWADLYGDFVKEYECAASDLTEAKENRKSHDDLLEKNKREYDKSIRRLKELNQQMVARLQCSPEVKLRVAARLKDLVTLLHAAKTVAELGLDEKLTEVASLNLPDVGILPADMEQRILQFVDGMSQELRQNSGTVADSILKDITGTTPVDSDLRDDFVKAVEKTSRLFDSWTHLEAMHLKAQLNNEVYLSEMERLKQEFQTEMAGLDQKSEVVQEALRRANLSTDKEDLRKALLDLAGKDGHEWTEADFDAFLSGTKVLNL